VEIHTHMRDGDVMRMRPVSGIDLPAGQAVTLQPGGLHLMLIGLGSALERGQRVPVTLVLERAGEVEVTLVVEAAGARGPSGAHGH
jgi:copper(I)-binding protein